MQNGFSDSGLRMNTWVAQQQKWTLAELETRNDMLMQRALDIWAMPSTSYKPAEKQLDSYTLDDDVDLSGREIIRFEYKNTEQPVTSWIIALEQILKILHAEDKSVLSILAHTHNPENDLDAYVSDNPADLRGAMEIDKGIFIERNTSTSTKISMLHKFFKAYGANPEDLVFYLKDVNDDRTAEEEGTRYELRRKYWAFALPYIQEAQGKSGSFQNVRPIKEGWLSGGFGIGGFSLICTITQKRADVTLALGKSNREKNKAAFDYLYARKDSIEKQLGTPLNWWRFDEGKASYISLYLNEVSYANETDWLQMAKFQAEWSKKFYDVFVPLLKEWNE